MGARPMQTFCERRRPVSDDDGNENRHTRPVGLSVIHFVHSSIQLLARLNRAVLAVGGRHSPVWEGGFC